jgi:hypothetical protein
MANSFDPSESEEFATAYRQHATTLRNWFVAYGVGGPALLLTNEKLQSTLRTYGRIESIGWCFLVGVGLQVLLSFFDKYADFVCYWRCLENVTTPTSSQKIASWWAKSNWPSILIELTSMGLFALATGTVFRAVLS